MKKVRQVRYKIPSGPDFWVPYFLWAFPGILSIVSFSEVVKQIKSFVKG